MIIECYIICTIPDKMKVDHKEKSQLFYFLWYLHFSISFLLFTYLQTVPSVPSPLEMLTWRNFGTFILSCISIDMSKQEHCLKGGWQDVVQLQSWICQTTGFLAAKQVFLQKSKPANLPTYFCRIVCQKNHETVTRTGKNVKNPLL